MTGDDSLLSDAREAFEDAQDHEAENRVAALDDLRFARLGEQWDDEIQRLRKGRPTHTINKLPTFIRQVTNDARMNKPQPKVRPVDSGADPKTAEIFNGLIRNIEQSSNAEIAYDTACDFAVTMGFGYFRIDVDYAHDDTFDQDIRIDRVSNPFNIYGDPYSTAADSSDWNSAFVVEPMPRKDFERRYKGAEPVDWDAYSNLGYPWIEQETVLVAEWWRREEASRTILLLSDGRVIAEEHFDPELFWDISVEQTRQVPTHKVTQLLLTGAEVIDRTDWPGRYIPIVPVYGDEVNVEGKRYFRSLIRDAKDPQRILNYWRSMTSELIALQPKAPWVGPETAFDGKDSDKWETANIENHPYLTYAGSIPPTREQFSGIPAGAMQEALNAADDIKAVTGIYDASLGARSNETSGRAIMARQREGDTSTFHFIDNLSRAVRHCGRILIDLIPSVYTGPRIIRILGEDGTPMSARLAGPDEEPMPNPPMQEPMQPNGGTGQEQAALVSEQEKRMGQIRGVFDLGAGKYDLAVASGPSYTTRRQETAEQILEVIRAFPQAATVLVDILAKNMDWPGADEIAQRLRALVPGEDPRLGQAMETIKALNDKIRKMELDRAEMLLEHKVDMGELGVKTYDAETKRMKVLSDTVGKAVPNAGRM